MAKKKISDKQRKKYKEIDWFWGTQVLCEICGKCSCESCHPNGPCISQKKKVVKKTIKEAKMVMHHDDPPCTARLFLGTGLCPKSNLVPDMQSLCLWTH